MTMKPIHLKRLSVFVLGLLGLTACTTFHSVEPIYPKVEGPRNLPFVESLQPTLKWKPSPEAESYDLIVYKPEQTKAFGENKERNRLMKIYYRERLTDTAHKLEEPLKPDAEYYWSVRIRSGEKVSDWSRYDHRLFLVLAWSFTTDALFGFKTPSK
jgi:hypothetical protein